MVGNIVETAPGHGVALTKILKRSLQIPSVAMIRLSEFDRIEDPRSARSGSFRRHSTPKGWRSKFRVQRNRSNLPCLVGIWQEVSVCFAGEPSSKSPDKNCRV